MNINTYFLGFSVFFFNINIKVLIVSKMGGRQRKGAKEKVTELTNNFVPYLFLLSKRYLHLLFPNS